jgi:AmmeMemoRadiSam system protein B
MNLDFMASPAEDHPGLLIRDPYQFSDKTLIIPPPIVPVLELFDGESTKLDLHQALVEITGELQVSDLVEHLAGALSDAGFLEDSRYHGIREAAKAAFANAPLRLPSHAGSAYPAEPAELREVFEEYLAVAEPAAPVANLAAIAAPHVSPWGGSESYRDAYSVLAPEYRDHVFVILGTSHYGAGERFGLTRKNFVTPAGEARTERALVDQLAAAAPGAVEMEDYCHRTEHSIEFQVAFLQHIYGPDVRILPILCGPYAKSLMQGGLPEDDENVRRFLGALGEMNAARSQELLWVLGVDMAHVGRRYGNPQPATAYQDQMLVVSARDKDRIERIAAGDARGFWEQVQPNHDDLNWCGSSPFYTFLKAVPEARGQLRRYQHWQIDPQSVVSFAAMNFVRG